MDENVYRVLANHLDRLPGGFPPSEIGADIDLLQYLFTPEEAELAVLLTLDWEDVETVAARAGGPVDAVAARLEKMAEKGLILPKPGSEPSAYQALPFIVGIYEFQVDRLNAAFLTKLGRYWETQKRQPRAETTRQMRTIPIGESISARLEVMPYEHLASLIAAQDRFAVMPCICRRTSKMAGGGCDAPEETCLVFGDWAEHMAGTGRGRLIERAEVESILAQSDAANLVLQPSNSRDISFVCSCCSCCCGILDGLKRHPKPAEAVANPFIVHFEPDLCENCGVCLVRCQMDAFAEGQDGILHSADRCIGCGLCVSTCPSDALTLVRKGPDPRYVPPQTMNDTWRQIAIEQADATLVAG